MECSSFMCATTGLLGILILLVARFWFKARSNHYWKTKNVPSVTPIPFLGNFLDLIGSNFFELDQKWYKQHGKVFGGYEGSMPVLFVQEPELLRQILVKDFNTFRNRRGGYYGGDTIQKLMLVFLVDEDWHRVRSVITPAFSTSKIKKMMPLLRESSETTTRHLLDAAQTGKPISAKKFFGAHAMDSIISIAFGTKLDSASDPENELVRNVAGILSQDYPWKFLIPYFFPKLGKYVKIKPFPKDMVDYVVKFTEHVVELRKRSKEVRQDLLQSLLDAQVSESEEGLSLEGDDLDPDDPNHYFKQMSKNKKISSKEFIAQCVSFFFAGYDSTTTTLSCVTYYLALNPECQEKLGQEIDRIWDKYPEMCYESLVEAKYLEACISETLRMSPPGIRLQRQAQEDYPLGDTGITISKGTSVIVSAYSMHHDPEFFPDPHRFNPDRFLPENKDQIRPYTYFPFGEGPRHCVAMRLAQAKVKAALFFVCRHVTFHRCQETQVPLEHYKGAFQYSPKDVTLTVKKRNIIK